MVMPQAKLHGQAYAPRIADTPVNPPLKGRAILSGFVRR
jgi:hypothetical protein